MTHEQEQDRERDLLYTRIGAADRNAVAPGRANASAALDGPVAPIASGILMRRDSGSGAVDNTALPFGSAASLGGAKLVDNTAEAAVARAAGSGTGHALPGDLQGKFETSLGVDLSDVRVHTGAASEAAAESVSARAYAVGNDIHFGANQYDPHSTGGQHLIAHEVAHTVQQRGGAATRQHKLTVSSAGDAFEAEADRAADAMITGGAATLTSGGRMISRKGDGKDDGKAPGADKDKKGDKDADKKWAENARQKIRLVQDAATSAQERLNADATKALTGLRQAQASFTSFEKRYEAALERFKAGVAAAQAAAQELRDQLSFVANTALAHIAPQLTAAVGAATGVLEKADKIASLAGAVGLVAKPKAKEPSSKEMGPSGKTDWKALLESTISTFESYVQQNKAIAETQKKCVDNDRYLTTVVEDKAGDNPQTTPEGTACEKMASNEGSITTQLGAIGDGSMSAPAVAFGTGASASLDKVDGRKIEQDIAIKWISTLKITVNGFAVDDQTEEIDDARSYLRGLGVEDRLGANAGAYMTDHDQRIVWMRARVEQEAMQLVGSSGDWLGGAHWGSGGGYAGKIRAGGGTWNAYGFDLGAEGGGSVQIQSYRIGELPKDTPSTGAAMPSLRALVTFTVAPQGKMGGGVPSGPTAEPAPAR